MSQWTHINGNIRFNSLRIDHSDHPKSFLGNMVKFEDDQSKWDNCDIPCGSEGSIEFAIHENPCDSSLAAFSVSFFGDLRDFSSIEEVEEYFDRVTDDKVIRDGIVQINNGELEVVLKYDTKNECFETISEVIVE